MYIYTHIHIYIYIYTHTHIYIYIFICSETPRRSLERWRARVNVKKGEIIHMDIYEYI